MNIETLLNNLFNIIYQNPEKLNIEYSNKDGKESLKINGEEMLKEFNDSNIKEDIKKYKENLELLDDCLFVEVGESLEEEINFKQMDELLSQEDFNQSEANLAYDLMKIVNNRISLKLDEKIKNLKNLKNKFN